MLSVTLAIRVHVLYTSCIHVVLCLKHWHQLPIEEAYSPTFEYTIYSVYTILLTHMGKLLGLMSRIVKGCVREVSLAQVSCILMYVYVAPPTPVGAWSMALGLRQHFEYYYSLTTQLSPCTSHIALLREPSWPSTCTCLCVSWVLEVALVAVVVVVVVDMPPSQRLAVELVPMTPATEREVHKTTSLQSIDKQLLFLLLP